MKLKATSGWFADHPWIGTAFLVGVGAGMIVCLPILPVELPESVAQIIGAGLGAGIAVGGAAWVAGAKTREQRKAFRELVRFAVVPVSA